MEPCNLAPAPTFDDRLRLMRLGTLWLVPMGLKALIDLGVPEIMLKAGRGAFLTPAEIAAHIPNSTAFTVATIERFLRLLTAHCVFDESVTESADGGSVERKYAINATSSLLAVDEEGLSMAYCILFFADGSNVNCGQYLSETSMDGMPPFVKANGTDAWTYGSQNPRFDDIFNKFMASWAKLDVTAFLRIFEGFKDFQGTLVDVAGGYGQVIRLIVEAHPQIKGINFDQPHVIAKAPIVPGVEHVGGDMFESIPKGDAILLKWILHDWSDKDCLVILKNVRKALPIGGKLLILEAPLPRETEEVGLTQTQLQIDLLMLTINVNGRERTEEEYRKMVLEAGFSSLETVYSGGCLFKVMQAIM